MIITIGMKRERALRLAEEIKAAFADPSRTGLVTVDAEFNDGRSDYVNIEISNDDMERDELPESAVYVSIDRS